MNPSTHPESKLSYERHFDDMVDWRPLLFRLHNSKTQATFFDAERTILLASRYASRSKEEPLDLLKSPDETPLSTLDEKSVANHVTSWKEGNTEPSEFISLTFNIFWVLWEWKRRTFYRPLHLPDEFFLIVLEGSELRGRSKLVNEIVDREIYKDAYNFANSAEEVVVAKFIHKEAILGTISMSQLQDFIPSWWKEAFEEILQSKNGASGQRDKSFKSFQSKLKPPAAAADCARQSLRFARELLAPLLVQNLQRRADIERAVDSTGRAIDLPQAGGVNIKVDPSDNNATLEKIKAEGERSGSPETGSLLATTGRNGDSPRNASPTKRRRVPENEPPRGNEDTLLAGSIDAEPSKPNGLPGEWKYVCLLATDVCCQGHGMNETEGLRKDVERMCTELALELLER